MTKPPDPVAFRQSLLHLLEALPPQEDRLLAELTGAKGRGKPVYSSLIYILSHLNFSEAEAKRHWGRIVAHRQRLGAALGRDVGLRVALLDYFVNVSRELKNPKVIEISIYESTERSAVTDGLTGLSNHMFFLQAARREVLRSRRYRLPMSVILVDLDNFKRLNDTWGHLEGDRFLVKVAALMKESLREIDMASRYGGEEFAFLLPDTPHAGAFVVAERLRTRIEAYFLRRKGVGVATVSGGIASFPDDGQDLETLLQRADEALYRSKAAGKNRMTLVSGERRRQRRVVLAVPVKVTPTGGRAQTGTTKNVSECGLLASVRRPLPLGSPVLVELRPRGVAPTLLRGTVIRLRRAGSERAAGVDLGIDVTPSPGLSPLAPFVSRTP